MALVSKYSTQYPSRAARCRLIFGEASQTEGEEETQRPHQEGLTTEGKMWEWMYGNGAEVPGVTIQTQGPVTSTLLKDLFKDIKDKQSCCFCDSGLQDTGSESKCLNNHTFGKTLLFPMYSRMVTDKTSQQYAPPRTLPSSLLGYPVSAPSAGVVAYRSQN